uniref:Involucrin-like n=1 Tax=Nicotiana tabacum TaxID=4097 RepID=A0A1S4BK83_TOBAC|nr:PREDICTED: involucrin-like [Nicotiana tabacum]
MLNRTGVSGPASGTSVSLQNPRLEDKQPKRRHSSMAGEKNKRVKIVALESSPIVVVTSPLLEPVIDTVMIDDDEEATTATSSPPVAPDHEESVPFRLSLVHGNLEQSYAAPYEDPQRKRNRLIREKEEISSARDRFLPKREQSVARLSELETKSTEAIVLEACLQQSEQEVETLSQQIYPLKVALNSKTEELAAAGAKHTQLEEKYRKAIEHNKIFGSIVCDLDVSLRSVRSTQESLSAELELAAKNGLPAEPDASGSSGSSSETSGTEEEAEDEDVEGQTGEGQNIEPSADLSTSPGGTNTSLPPGPRDAAV